MFACVFIYSRLFLDCLLVAGQSNIRLLVRLVLKGVRGLNHWNTLPVAPLMTALNSGNFKIYIFSILDVRMSLLTILCDGHSMVCISCSYILKSGSATSSRFLPWLSWKDYEFHGNSSTKCLPVYLFIPDYLWIAGQSNIRLLVRLVLKGVRGLNHWNTLPAAPLMTALNSGNFKIYIFSILDVRHKRDIC